ncbi:hypothetical protein C1H46_028529 [Malus baccata]|uniref:Uncharacterized protein n=1 Tax=Malus baccata TaxID=106549 RepID=A0A540LHW6_MALBA|nr:hypothetical protein C1H46_028529 [Malus baccata]
MSRTLFNFTLIPKRAKENEDTEIKVIVYDYFANHHNMVNWFLSQKGIRSKLKNSELIIRLDEPKNISKFTILCESHFTIQKLNIEPLNQQNGEEERYRETCVCLQ